MGKITSFLHKLVKPFKKKSVLAVVAVVAAASVVGVNFYTAQAERADCDANAVLYCGAYDVNTLINKYNNSSSAQQIYGSSTFGISSGEFKSLANGYVNGVVTRNNTVVVNGKTVATGVVTAGRQYIPGSHTIPGAPGYSRAPSVSFKQYSLSAFVKLDQNGRFLFAIIKACGNPVVGTPTQPPAPKPKPNYAVEKMVRLANTQDVFKNDITVKTGQQVEYVIAVTNTGNTTLQNVLVHDKLPNSMSYVDNSTRLVTSYNGSKDLPDGVIGHGVTIGNVPVKGTAYVFFKANVPKASNTNLKICETGQKSVLHNTAYAKPANLVEKNNGADVRTCRPGTPNFSIEKQVKIAGTKDKYTENVSAAPGTLLEFVVAVKNTGNIDLKNMVVTDDLPKGLTYKSGTTRLVTSTGTNKALPDAPSLFYKGVTITTVKPSETAFITFQAYLPKADSTAVEVKTCETGNTKLVNVAKAKPAGLNTKQNDASAETCKKTPPKPSFTIQKDVRKKGASSWGQDTTVKYGESVEYRIVVTNTGETALKNVLVKDVQPVGVSYVNGSLKIDGQPSNQDLFGSGATIANIPLRGTAEITFEAKVTAQQPSECMAVDFKNIASAKPEGLEVKNDDAIIKVNCVVIEHHPKFEITKTASKPVVDVNEQFSYTLNVTNTGDIDLKNVKVTDAAPAGVAFISSSKPDGTTVNVTAANFEATIDSLAKNQTVTFTIVSKITSEQPAGTTNTACVDAVETPGNPDDCDTVTVKTPKYVCSALESLSLGDYKYRFTVIVSKSATVDVTSVSYNFGDGSNVVIANNQNPVDHQYATPDKETTYKAVATVTFSVGGVSRQSSCETSVKLQPKPQEVCPYNKDLPKDSPYCFEPCKYDASLPSDSPDCVPPITDVCPEIPGVQTSAKDCETPNTPPAPVSVVPSTGSEGVATMALGSGGTIYALYAWVESKRSLRKK